jgi:hypothetical protein
MSRLRPSVIAVLIVSASVALVAQDTQRVEFEAVSIKRNTVDPPDSGGGFGSSDGSEGFGNITVGWLIRKGSSDRTLEVIGLPEWATTERYDVRVKSRAGATSEQRREMWQRMFAERMKLAAHVEQHQRDSEKTMTTVLVIDHIERPSEN